MNQLYRRLQYFVNRSRRDQELEDEMAFHREMASRGGCGAFGNVLRLREDARDAWGWTWIDRSAQDLRYAARVMRRSPGFTLAAILMLAIGIGVNIAAFGFFNLMVLRPLPVRDPETLLRFERRAPERYASALPYPEIVFFQEYSRTLSAVLGLTTGSLSADTDGPPLTAHFVTRNFFDDLGDVPRLGRTFDRHDEAADAGEVVVLAHGFWQRRFGGDSSVLGRQLRLDGRTATVIGVASERFSGLALDPPDVWLPIDRQPHYVSGSRLLTDCSDAAAGVRMWGRLRPGITPQMAEDELGTLAAELRRRHPGDIWEHESLPSAPGGYATGLMNGDRRGTGAVPRSERYPILALMAVLVLLILTAACGNLGSLLLARGVARAREMTIRASVGAGRRRLLRQLLTESLLLGLLGSLAGLALGYAVLRGLMLLSDTPAWLNPAPDWRVVLFAVGMGWAAAVLFGLAPALQIVRGRHHSTMLRQVLIGGQVAASCVLLIVSGLLVRAVIHASSMQPGFEFERVLSVDPGLAAHGYSPERARAYFETLRDRLHALPGVTSVAMTSAAPLGRRSVIASVVIDARPLSMQVNYVDPAFFPTMGIPLVRGRTLARGDGRAVVVGQSLALRAWPGENALGKQLTLGEDANGAPVSHTVVGVVGSARLLKPEDPDVVEIYFPVEGGDLTSMVLLVRTSGPPERVALAATSLAQAVDRTIHPDVQLLRNSFERKIQSTRYTALSVGLLGFVALVLACLGIVGLVAYAVSQRTREIGIRMALGARPSDVLLVVLRRFSRPVLAGVFLGACGAAALSELLRSQLYGVSSLDPITYCGALGLFLLTATGAALVPARRALQVEPVRALRHE